MVNPGKIKIQFFDRSDRTLLPIESIKTERGEIDLSQTRIDILSEFNGDILITFVDQRKRSH